MSSCQLPKNKRNKKKRNIELYYHCDYSIKIIKNMIKKKIIKDRCSFQM